MSELQLALCLSEVINSCLCQCETPEWHVNGVIKLCVTMAYWSCYVSRHDVTRCQLQINPSVKMAVQGWVKVYVWMQVYGNLYESRIIWREHTDICVKVWQNQVCTQIFGMKVESSMLSQFKMALLTSRSNLVPYSFCSFFFSWSY